MTNQVVFSESYNLTEEGNLINKKKIKEQQLTRPRQDIRKPAVEDSSDPNRFSTPSKSFM